MAENGDAQAGDQQATQGNENQEAQQQEAPTGQADLGDAGKKALDTERAARKEAEKLQRATQRELDQVRQAAMSDDERKIAEAKQAGRSEASTEFGKRLARSEFATAAARRNVDYDAAQALEYIDLGRFVGDDGEPDTKAIAAAVERLIPAPSGGTPSFDGGTRGAPASGQDMNALLRRAAGRT